LSGNAASQASQSAQSRDDPNWSSVADPTAARQGGPDQPNGPAARRLRLS
jgi:hypothetical protein